MENRRVSMNRHTNLLQLEEHMYPLVDVATPNVFRNLFIFDYFKHLFQNCSLDNDILYILSKIRHFPCVPNLFLSLQFCCNSW